jgi:hypothetical protein
MGIVEQDDSCCRVVCCSPWCCFPCLSSRNKQKYRLWWWVFRGKQIKRPEDAPAERTEPVRARDRNDEALGLLRGEQERKRYPICKKGGGLFFSVRATNLMGFEPLHDDVGVWLPSEAQAQFACPPMSQFLSQI